LLLSVARKTLSVTEFPAPLSGTDHRLDKPVAAHRPVGSRWPRWPAFIDDPALTAREIGFDTAGMAHMPAARQARSK